MRRIVLLALATVAATAATLGLSVTPAAAHICPIAVQIPVGREATIAVGVTVEDATVPDVEITFPAGLRLDRVDTKAGWAFSRTGTPTGTPAGSTVRYRGGPIPPFKCEYFSFGVTAAGPGAFGIPVVQRAADGSVVARTIPVANNASDQVLDQFVYAGVKPPRAGGSSNVSVPTIAGIALVAIGIVAFVALTIRRRRDLQARVQRFKKRTPDPPPS
ncbi:MAG TPA: hypothetical protein VGP92_06455 [Acidimicrobiia bacterium]|nr:hypothetical protein [Acidimicrobiia bacterium]